MANDISKPVRNDRNTIANQRAAQLAQDILNASLENRKLHETLKEFSKKVEELAAKDNSSSELPLNVQLKIFEMLNKQDLIQCKRVCKSWHTYIKDCDRYQQFHPDNVNIRLINARLGFHTVDIDKCLYFDEMADASRILSECPPPTKLTIRFHTTEMAKVKELFEFLPASWTAFVKELEVGAYLSNGVYAFFANINKFSNARSIFFKCHSDVLGYPKAVLFRLPNVRKLKMDQSVAGRDKDGLILEGSTWIEFCRLMVTNGRRQQTLSMRRFNFHFDGKVFKEGLKLIASAEFKDDITEPYKDLDGVTKHYAAYDKLFEIELIKCQFMEKVRTFRKEYRKGFELEKHRSTEVLRLGEFTFVIRNDFDFNKAV